MKKIVFATGNPNKIKEVNQLLDGQFSIVGMREIGCTEEVPETQNTLEGNALQKARYLKDNYDYDCFSEDTGLEIDALDGAPGVITAHYAGPERNAIANMEKVLEELKGKEDRSAQFRTVIALIWEGKEHLFEGIVRGKIATERSGEKGFGYDPIFIPEGFGESFAHLDSNLKNSISHRGRAVKQLIDFFRKSK